jgi:hypothetical protein
MGGGGPGVVMRAEPCGGGGDAARCGAERRKARRAHGWRRVRGGRWFGVSGVVG